MQVDLYAYDGDGKLQPIKCDCELNIIPRIGESVSIGDRRTRAKVIDVEYLLPNDSDDMLVAVILEHAPRDSAG